MYAAVVAAAYARALLGRMADGDRTRVCPNQDGDQPSEGDQSKPLSSLEGGAVIPPRGNQTTLQGIKDETAHPHMVLRRGVGAAQIFPLQDGGPLVVGRLFANGSTLTMSAVARSDGRRIKVDANPIGKRVDLIFDLTNVGTHDVRIVEFHVEVVEYADVEVKNVVWWSGALLTQRTYRCRLGPAPGRYRCDPIERAPGEYIRLSRGELEEFVVEVSAEPRESSYRVRLIVEYSSGGAVATLVLDRTVEFGFFDPQQFRIHRY